jgi:GTP-binding protein HflX
LFFERPDSGERALLVHLNLSTEADREDPREFEELVLSAGGDPVEYVFGQREAPHPRYFVGTGKLEEISALVQQHDIEVVLFNHALSPSQERNLEKELKCRVLDRTGLILDIFAQRARTHEGKLQVELAQLQHMSTRLVRGWTHLERQKGGIGLRGPGETQLETDRRLIGVRIRQLKNRLERVDRQREQSRRQRKRSRAPLLALVGYTNAGKSTLFNRLTGAHVGAEDLLFATLDPTVRKIRDTHFGDVLLADTVGFVSDLPHELIAAFRATLQEAREADLLLHVMDISDPYRMERQQDVETVLESIGADAIPSIRIFNKIDIGGEEPVVHRDDNGRPVAVAISAVSGEGVAALREVIGELLADERIERWIELEGSDGRLRAQLFELGVVSEERITENGHWMLHVDVPRETAERLARQPGKEGEVARSQLLV